MIRTLIVDDEPLPRERIRTLLAGYRDIEMIGECRDGREAVNAILTERPDLVFLDIRMPELDGFEVIKAVNPEYLPAIIFVTAFDEHAIRAFEVNAIDYLLKPINPARFEKAVRRAIDRLTQGGARGPDRKLLDFVERLRAGQQYATRFVVRSGPRLSFVRASDVDWIDVADNYVRLHVSGREHLVRDTLKSVESQLDPESFVRVHRSIIINLDRVESVEPWFHGEYAVTMKDGAKFTTSRSYSERLRLLLR
ncbi:MAG TPA: LytTR family transcriptional regulator DNA-binding domain-containing protein [Blastocatellia bacterium]|nr:LytTR family transcriptional regulator DNA-binding domain-containing protein [Blastocatellia bacterium]